MSCIHNFFFFYTRCFVKINTFLSNAYWKDSPPPTAFCLIPKLLIHYTDKYCVVFITGEWQGKSGSGQGGIHSGVNIPTNDKCRQEPVERLHLSRGLFELAHKYNEEGQIFFTGKRGVRYCFVCWIQVLFLCQHSLSMWFHLLTDSSS